MSTLSAPDARRDPDGFILAGNDPSRENNGPAELLMDPPVKVADPYRWMRDGNWAQGWQSDLLLGTDLSRATVGVVGAHLEHGHQLFRVHARAVVPEEQHLLSWRVRLG